MIVMSTKRIEILCAIRSITQDLPSCSLGDIVKATHRTKSSVNHHVRVLREHGYISPVPKGRRIAITLTEKGRDEISMIATASIGWMGKVDLL